MEVDKIVCAEVMDFLRGLPDNSVHCVVTSVPYYGLRAYLPDDHPDKNKEIGLEEMPQAWLAKLVEVFHEVWRVLRPDGTCWVNVGDSYAAQGGPQIDGTKQTRGSQQGAWNRKSRKPARGFKPKDLMMMPARLAIALQDDGWFLRNEIVWSKSNAMPEAVTDRCSKTHEMIYLFEKQAEMAYLLTKEGEYFFDRTAIREAQTGNTHSRGHGRSPKEKPGHDDLVRSNHSFNASMTAYTVVPGGRNRRTVWTVPTEANGFDHFACFPRKLVEPMILAGCPERVCAICGAPWERVFIKTGHQNKREKAHQPNNTPSKTDSTGWLPVSIATNEWCPTCTCDGAVDAGIALDPFMGSGTTALVARSLGRHFLGCDLNPEYVKLANDRLAAPWTPPLPIETPPQPEITQGSLFDLEESEAAD